MTSPLVALALFLPLLGSVVPLAPIAPIAASALVAPTVAPLAPSAPVLGPVMLCFPLDVGGFATLPEPGSSASDADVLGATQAILRGSDVTLVHMETLRRAVLTLQGDRAALGRLLAALEEELARADGAAAMLAAASITIDPDLSASWARTRFDLAYARAAAADAGWSGPELARVAGDMAAARAALPEDGGLALGAALVSFARRQPSDVPRHLRDARAAARGGDEHLARSIRATFGALLGRKTDAALDAWVDENLEHA